MPSVSPPIFFVVQKRLELCRPPDLEPVGMDGQVLLNGRQGGILTYGSRCRRARLGQLRGGFGHAVRNARRGSRDPVQVLDRRKG